MLRLSPEALRAILRERGGRFYPALPGRKNHLQAGVLVPLAFDDELRVFLTKRPSTMPRHAGEICFPGGRPSSDDPDIEATALREANEEIGVRSPSILGRLASTPLYTSDYRLEPFVAAVDPNEIEPDPHEVERLIEVSITRVLMGPYIEAIPFRLYGGVYMMPIFSVEGGVVYGGTAQLLYELLSYVALAVGRGVPPFRESEKQFSEIVVAPNG
ncbi:MAG: CoA pyrophosphatase [Sandaracinaceae bacterium]|nr:CoA pyrophosphatase [Sandaracinaceae bacterium]